MGGPCARRGPTNDDESAPKAFVTILLFDKNYVLQDATWDQVSTAGASAHDLLTTSYTVKQPGYACFFVSNEHPTYADIYFDDVTVSHTQSPIVAGSDYYPFGLVMDGMEITDEKYRYGYQGQFSEKDATTGWNEFELRMYDKRFGRWLSVDPYGQFASGFVGMGNNPVMGVDPNGGWSWVGAGVGALAGFGVGAIVSTFTTEKGDWLKLGLIGAGVGLIAGGLIGEAAHSSWDHVDVGHANGWDRFTAFFNEGEFYNSNMDGWDRYTRWPQLNDVANVKGNIQDRTGYLQQLNRSFRRSFKRDYVKPIRKLLKQTTKTLDQIFEEMNRPDLKSKRSGTWRASYVDSRYSGGWRGEGPAKRVDNFGKKTGTWPYTKVDRKPEIGNPGYIRTMGQNRGTGRTLTVLIGSGHNAMLGDAGFFASFKFFRIH